MSVNQFPEAESPLTSLRVVTMNLWGTRGAWGPTLEISTCARLFDEPKDGVWASDHFGLVADLSIPRRTYDS